MSPCGAGFSFYVSWVLFSLMGILLANKVPDLSTLHLEFSIVVVFLVMAVPHISACVSQI
jgi:predicted branched-subunit amino acid permease